MNIGRTICLVVALTAAGSLHAQNCSGGPDGGMDATGNQCSTPTDVANYTTASWVAPLAQASTMGGVQRSVPAVLPAVRLGDDAGRSIEAGRRRGANRSGRRRKGGRPCAGFDLANRGRLGIAMLGRPRRRNGRHRQPVQRGSGCRGDYAPCTQQPAPIARACEPDIGVGLDKTPISLAPIGPASPRARWFTTRLRAFCQPRTIVGDPPVRQRAADSAVPASTAAC